MSIDLVQARLIDKLLAMKLPFLEGLDKRISFHKKYEYDDEPGAPLVSNTVSHVVAAHSLLHF